MPRNTGGGACSGGSNGSRSGVEPNDAISEDPHILALGRVDGDSPPNDPVTADAEGEGCFESGCEIMTWTWIWPWIWRCRRR